MATLEALVPLIRADVAEIKTVTMGLRDDLVARRAQPSQPSQRVSAEAGRWWKRAMPAVIGHVVWFLAVCICVANQASLTALKIPGGP